jgi:signal transduction histidine kinase
MVRRAGVVGLAAVVAFLQLVGTNGAARGEDRGWSMGVVAAVLLLAGPVGLLVRRRLPELSLGVAFAAAAAFPLTQTNEPDGPAGFPALIVALFSAMLAGRRAFGWGTIAVGYVAFVWLPWLVSDESPPGLGDALGLAAWLLLMGTAAEAVRVRRERRAEMAHAQAEEAHARAEEARRRASEERLLIAHELHDVLAHNISLINVQAGVALHLLEERPEQARPALAAIKDASKEALGELRSVLDVLRRGENGAQAPRAPNAGLRDLGGLVQRTRDTGLDVRLDIEGDVRPVPAGVDLAAFRIVQEALTNVVRHAGDALASVRLVYRADELVVRVDDDGQGVTQPGAGPGATGEAGDGAGKGIAGMRERVRALGGSFVAGPRPGRGFRVRARFPLEPAPDGDRPDDALQPPVDPAAPASPEDTLPPGRGGAR